MRGHVLLICTALLLLVFLTGCDILPVAETDTEPDAESLLELQVGPDGGEFDVGSNFQLTVPAGAFSSDTTISIEQIDAGELSTAPGSEYELISGLYRLTISGSLPQTPLVLEFAYTGEHNPASLRVIHFKQDHYHTIRGEVDATRKTVTVSVDEFSSFGLFVDTTLSESNTAHVAFEQLYDFTGTDTTVFTASDDDGWNGRHCWGPMDDPTGSDRGNILYSGAIHDGLPANGEFGTFEGQIAALRFSVPNDQLLLFPVLYADVFLETDASLYSYRQSLRLYVSTTAGGAEASVGWAEVDTDGWERLSWDLSTDLNSALGAPPDQPVWGDPNYSVLYFALIYALPRVSATSDNGLFGCYLDNLYLSRDGTDYSPEQVAAPSFSPSPGTYSEPQTVAISCPTTGTTIRYTTNGDAPSRTAGHTYSNGFLVDVSSTVRAFAYKTDWLDSAISSSAYTITGTVATPVFDPPAGAYGTAQAVTVSCATDGATIYYTVNGTEPTADTGLL